MRKKRRVLRFLIISICAFLLYVPVLVSASDSVDAIKFIKKNEFAILELCDEANKSVGYTILKYTDSSGVVRFSNKKYHKLTSDEKKKFMEVALGGVKESGISNQAKNKLYNFIAEQDGTVSDAIRYLKSDTSADFVSAFSWLKPFTGVLGTFLGFLCLVIFIMLSISNVVDLAFLFIPGFQTVVEAGMEDKRPFFISREAWSSVREEESSTEYVNVLSLYLRRRTGSIVLVSICLLYLISGQLYDVMLWIVDSFGSIFDGMFS